MVAKECISSLEAEFRVSVILLELATEETRKSFPKHNVSHHFSCKNHLGCSFVKVTSVSNDLFILVHTIFIIFSREEETWGLSYIYNILFFNNKTPKQYYKMTFSGGGWNGGYIGFCYIYSY